MAGINPIISIITLSGNRLNMPLRRLRLSQWMKPQDITSIEDIFQIQRYKQVQSKIMEKIFHTNNNTKNAEVATLIAYEIDFEVNSSKDKERLFLNDNGQ